MHSSSLIPPHSHATSAVHDQRLARRNRRSVELCEHLADDLRRLVRREYVAAFGVGYLRCEVCDGVDAANEYVAQRFGASFGIVQLFDGAGDVVLL